MTPQSHKRNFSIIAHIDHGKSTLSDRLIERCGALTAREMSAQILDSMDIERERGITIKAQSVSLLYTSPENGEQYQLNFIDTPGHVDFSYEVSRSLAACEGALLIVDASQGVEAQTVANCYQAIDQQLEVLPVLNKVDLPAADTDKARADIEEMVGIDASYAIEVSAKTGLGIDDLLAAIIKHIPPPEGDAAAPLQALIIDSWFDSYLGVVSLVRIVNGTMKKGERVRVVSTGNHYEVGDVGMFSPKRTPLAALHVGEVGYVVCGVKNILGVPVGDTITHHHAACAAPLSGFKTVQPRVFSGLYPVSHDQYDHFRESLEKLKLNDSALQYEPETSDALGLGFRCGFVGLLHMEIVQERLEREYNLELLCTAPTVLYKVTTSDGEARIIHNPSALPPANHIKTIAEPMIEANLYTPEAYLGEMIKLCTEKRGIQVGMVYSANQVHLTYRLPLSEVVLDFFEKMKSLSRGYASMDYALSDYEAADLVRVDILINGERVDALSLLLHRTFAVLRGRALLERLKDIIPRQMFEIALQAAIGGKIIARTNIKAMRKNVTAKCYGGDVSRKKKLLEKQKKGKRRMKSIGRVDIPQEAFMAILSSH